MRLTLTFAVAMLLGISGVQGQTPLGGAEEMDLKLVQMDQSQVDFLWGIFDKTGQLSISPFANDAGKLLVRLEGETVRVDTNGDGVIDEKDEPAFKPNQTIVKVCCKFLGKAVQYPFYFLRVSGSKNNETRFLTYGSLAALEGSYNHHTVRLRENNRPSGRFLLENLQVQLDSAKQDESLPRWSPVLMLDWKLLNAEYIPERAKIRFTPYLGAVARVKLELSGQFLGGRVLVRSDKQIGWITKSDKQGGMIRLGQESLLVPGVYSVVSILLEKDGKNMFGQPLGLASKTAISTKPFTFDAGENSLKIGPPLRMECKIQRDGEKITIVAADILGVAGESYRLRLDRTYGDSCSWFVRAGGREQELGKLEFG